MQILLLSLFFVCFTTIFAYSPTTYQLVKDYQAGTNSFFDQFTFYTGADPTHGFVNYYSRTNAQNAGMIWNWNGASYFSANFWNTAPTGRPSVRLHSNAAYSEVLIIADFAHVPGGSCGSWPAFWTSNLSNWPNGGEIDIYEGVNTAQANHYSFHTGPNCIQGGQVQTGYGETWNCDVNAAGQFSNAGCGGWASTANTYGYGMNNIGDGVYAMDWRLQGIRIWFFPRGSVPQDILNGAPTTAGWGTPMADLPSTWCNIPNHFYNHQIIFDITFCGDWANAVYTPWGCPGTCTNQVANNPYSFWSDYWGVNSLKVYKATTPV